MSAVPVRRRPAAGRLDASAQRRLIEDAIERLISILDDMDASGEDREPEPVDDDGFGDCEIDSWD